MVLYSSLAFTILCFAFHFRCICGSCQLYEFTVSAWNLFENEPILLQLLSNSTPLCFLEGSRLICRIRSNKSIGGIILLHNFTFIWVLTIKCITPVLKIWTRSVLSDYHKLIRQSSDNLSSQMSLTIVAVVIPRCYELWRLRWYPSGKGIPLSPLFPFL